MRVAKVLALTASVATLFGLASCSTLQKTFQDPPKAARPWVRWWWPGGAVEDSELAREIAVLDGAGFGGGEIQPFNPGITHLSPEQRLAVNDYATPSFFARVKSAADAAARRGLQLDYTFGSAWPSGGGLAITPELALLELTVARTGVDGGAPAPIKVTVPLRSRKLGVLSPLDPRTKDPRVADWPSRMDSRAQLVAVIAVKGADPQINPDVKTGGFKLFSFGAVVTRPGELEPGTQIVLTDKLNPDGTLDWAPPPGHWQVLVFKQYAANSGVMAGVGEGPQLVLDHFNPEAFAAHAHRVGDPLIAALGPAHGGLRATFIDSLELMPDLYWSADFLEQFRTRRGYDLTSYLPLILQPGWMESWDDHYSPPCYVMGDIGERVRADYQQTVSELFMERFVDPYVKWNRDHSTLARFQAHGAPVDLVEAYGRADIPETEDLYEFADPHFMRIARSAADLYGHRLVSAESLVWQDRPYSVTPLEMRRRADLLYASGVNELILHGFPYVLSGQSWPGWHPFAPSPFTPGFSNMFAEANPIWAAVPELARYMGRLQAVLQQGRNVVPVALFLEEIGYFKGIEDHGAGQHRTDKALIAGGYDYDRITEHALSAAHVEGKRLVTASGARFEALVLPPLESIRAETIERIAQLAKDGLPVVFADSAPAKERGFLDHVERDQRVATAVGAARSAGAQVVPVAAVPDQLRALEVPANLRFAADAPDVLFVEKDVDGRRAYFLHNAGSEPRDATFDTRAAGAPQRWNALDGTIVAQAARVTANTTRVSLQLSAGESALIVFDPSRPARTGQPAVPRTTAERSIPTTGWTLHASGHGAKGREVDFTQPAAALTDWRQVQGIEDLSGSGVYTRTLDLDRAWLERRGRVMLDLGEFHDVAVVTVNGHPFAPVWEAGPLDITRAVHAGANALSIAVDNTPNNALLDPKQPGFKNLKPQPAGLIGPVVLRAVRPEMGVTVLSR